MGGTKYDIVKKLNELDEIKQDAYLDIFYYMIVVGVMCFFIYIILSDLYKVIKLHSIQNEDSLQMFKSTSPKSSKSKMYNDDNDFEIDFMDEVNRNKQIIDSLSKSQMSIYNGMKDMIDFKKENNLDGLEINVDENNISDKHDNWNYPIKRKDTNFWNMIFEQPKHYSMVNNSGGEYISSM